MSDATLKFLLSPKSPKLQESVWTNNNLIDNIILKIDINKTYPKIYKFVTDFMEFKKRLRKVIDDNDPRLENVPRRANRR